MMDWSGGEFDAGAAGPGRESGARNDSLFRVVIPGQNLVVRLNGLSPDTPEDEFLAVVRPYGIARMAWAIWREVPGVAPSEALSLALRVRRKGEAEVLVATELLAEYVRLGLRARHRLAARLERV